MPILSIQSVRKPILADITVMLTNRDANGDPVQADNGSFDPHFSPDGNFVMFTSQAANLAGGSPNGADVFLRDLRTGAISLVSIGQGPNAPVPDAGSSYARFGPDSNNPFVVFNSSASNLIVGHTDGNGTITDIFLKNLIT